MHFHSLLTFYICAYYVAIYEAEHFYALTINNGIATTSTTVVAARAAVSTPQIHTRTHIQS